ncbi:MAG TPA: DUF4249 family protein [Gemmatimonadaceae bacterium]|jgi:hypothetical protein
MATLVASSCKFNEITIPQTTPAIVVHAVLNPPLVTQVVLVERTLTGAQPVQDSIFNPADPIRSDGGIPVSGASVALIDTTGREFTGIEDRVNNDSQGTGVYRINLPAPLRPGGRYSLRIRTTQGETVTAETRIPAPLTTSTGALTKNFNRDHDTLNIRWDPTPLTRAYAVRVESPFGPYFLLTDSTGLRLVGDARNIFANNLEHLFIPGFRQDVVVAAVDSNFYDYYRTNNDPFTGSGIISRINGGLGLFGALYPLTSGTLAVAADQTELIEGRFRATPPTTDPQRVATLNLYVESHAERSDLPDVLSGRYTSAGNSAITNGIVGEMTGSHVTLVLVSNQLAHDTVDVFSADLSTDGTTLTGTFRTQGATRFTYVKQ